MPLLRCKIYERKRTRKAREGFSEKAEHSFIHQPTSIYITYYVTGIRKTESTRYGPRPPATQILEKKQNNNSVERYEVYTEYSGHLNETRKK